MAGHVQRRHIPLLQDPVPGAPMQLFRSGLSNLKIGALFENGYTIHQCWIFFSRIFLAR